MILGIISDTHDRVARTERAVAAMIAGKAEALIHCGDLTGPEVVLACAELPCHYVFGNNDFDEDALRRAMAETGGVCLERGGEVMLGGRRIAVTHGDSIREVNRLAYATPDYLLYGHSHLFADDRRGATRWINPGALHRAPSWTVALLDLGRDDLRFLEVDAGR